MDRISENILFKNLSSEDKTIIVDAMQEVTVAKGDTIIKEGDQGNEFFVVDVGELDCYKIIEDKNRYLKTYYIGEGFGELALLYNAPRAASIVAKTAATLFKLDRGTFTYIVLESTIKKRKVYGELIDSIEILQSLTKYEK